MSGGALSPVGPSAKRLALLERLRRERGLDREGPARIRRFGGSGPAPSSIAQEALCVVDRLLPGVPLYNLPFLLHLDGDLDRHDLERALGDLAERHESLRTRFTSDGGGWVQEIDPPASAELPRLDLAALPEGERRTAFEEQVSRLARRPFDLSRGPLHRTTLFCLAPRRHALLVTLHHAVADARSVAVYARDLRELYRARRAGRTPELPALPVRPVDHARWQRAWLAGEEAEQSRRALLEGLADAEPLDLPFDGGAASRRTHRRGEAPVTLPAPLLEPLVAIGRSEGTTPFVTLLALFGALLHRWSGQDRFLVVSPVSLRHHREVEDLVGDLVDLLPIPVDLSGNPTFRELVARVRDAVIDGQDHRDYPFERLVEELRPDRAPGATPLAGASFGLDDATDLPPADGEDPAVVLEEVATGTVKSDLSLALRQRHGSAAGALAYDRGLFAPTTVARWAGHLRALSEAFAEAPDLPAADAPLLDRSQRHQLLLEWNDTEPPAGFDAPVGTTTDRFAAEAARRPDAVAVVDGARHVTFRQLARRSRRLALQLRRAGARRGARAGVGFEPSAEAVVAVLAAMESGAAFVPLDPDLPDERLRRMIEDAGVSVALAGEGRRRRFEALGVAVLVPSDDADAPRDSGELPPPADEDDLAYVLYTSGSTGEPKGVMVGHRSLARHLDVMGEALYSGSLPAAPLVTRLSFDAVFVHLLAPLLRARPVRVPAPDLLHRPADLLASLAERPGELFDCVPSLWRVVLATAESGEAPAPVDLTLLLGGEPLDRGLVDRSRAALPGVQIWNVYGPTEATGNATFGRVDDSEAPVDLGRLLPAARAYVVDARGRPVPLGAPGELWLAGDGVARGYLGRTRLTAERFVPEPWGERAGGRAYRTGDRVRALPSGRFEYLGRLDQQVKVRGVRIEPGEIEAVLASRPGIRQAVVLALPESDGSHRLAACLVADGDRAPTTEELVRFTAERLPEAMVPSTWLRLDELPRTVTGKLDRRALTEEIRAREVTARSAATPGDLLEEVLCGVFADLLGRDEVGVEADFFALGGHSLLAIRVLARVRSVLGVDLPLQALFEAPTVAALARRVAAARAAGESAGPPPEPLPASAEKPLSFAQQRLWLLDELEPESALYNVPFALRLHGEPRIDALAAAASEVVDRHQVLRTRFVARDGEPRQEVAPSGPVPVPLVDLSALPESVRGRELDRLSRAVARLPFALAAGLLLRMVLLREGERDAVLAVSIHHVASDARSSEIFLQELAAGYRAVLDGRSPAEAGLPELPIQYADYATWQRKRLEEERLERLVARWRERLAGLPPLLELPADRPRPAVRTDAGAVERFAQEAAPIERLGPLLRREGATLFMGLLAAYHGLLHRLTGRADLAVGTPISGRGQVETENLIGFFLDTLVIRARVDGEASFRDLLRRVRNAALAAFDDRELPFERLVEELQPDRSLSHTPLFQTLFVLQDERTRDRIDLPGLEACVSPFETGTSKFDLSLSLSQTPDGFRGSVEYDTDLFDRSTIRRLIRHWRAFVAEVARDPDRPLAGVPLLDRAERHQVTVEWNDTAAALPGEPVHGPFERVARRVPDTVALRFGHRSLTYRELGARSARLARHLVSLGVGPEVPVGVCVERSAEMMIAALAVARAGGACLPLDPSYPADRLAFMLEESGARVVLALTSTQDVLPEHGATTVLLDRETHLQADDSPEAPAVDIHPESPLYVIYTSGSTGRPKGVVLPHGALANLLAWYLRELPGPSTTLQFASLSFDVSFMEAYATWSAGGTLVVAPEEARRDPELLSEVLERAAIERVTLPVVLLHQLAAVWAEDGPPACLRDVASTGEQLRVTPRLAALFARRPGLPLHNLYGPSESHVVTAHTLGADPRLWPHHPPIGRPVASTRIEILDRHLRPVPIGVAGELAIAGANLARGYLGRPGLTAERFVPDPLGPEPGARVYRTGDLARHRPDGTLEYLGRTDHQIKIRGFRVEPGEIEAALTDHPAVAEAVVLALDDGGAERRLTAWYVPASGGSGATDATELRAHLRERLPEYMVPAAFVRLDALPLNPNRKIDRDALPRPERAPAGDRRPPRTPTEKVVAAVWCRALRLDEVGRDEGFFELGGHSLLATRVISRLRAAFGVEVPLRRLFEEPTVAGLAAAVDELTGEGAAPVEPIRPRPEGAEAPLSFAQERILFVGELAGDSGLFNLSMGFRLKGEVDAGVLDRALCEIVRRHEVLRSAFSSAGDRWSQIAERPPATLLQVRDLRHVALDGREEAARGWVEEEAWRPFDLSAAPQIRAGLLRLSDDEQMFLATTHHAVFDGWSMRIFLRELSALYRAFGDRRLSPLDEPEIQYGDFAAWQRDRLRGERLKRLLAHWRSHLAGAPETLELPTDRPRPAVRSHRGGRRRVAVPPDDWERFQALCRREGASGFMGLLAAFALVLHRASRQDDLVIGSPVAGRDRTEVEPLLGCFINNLAVRVRLDGDPTFRNLLAQVRETTLGAYAHQELPFEVLVEDLSPARDLSRSPIFQAMLVTGSDTRAARTAPSCDDPDHALDLPGVEVTAPLGSSTAHAEVDLSLWMTDWHRGRGFLDYDAELFDGTTAARWLGLFHRVLVAVAGRPEVPVSALDLLAPAERWQLLREWNDTRTDVPEMGSCLHHLFAARAAEAPDRVALVHAGREMPYGELARRVNRVAGTLRSLGVGPEATVGLYVERSLEMVVGLLGTLTAGAAYLPLDPAHPRERIAATVEDAGVSLVLVHGATADRLDAERFRHLRHLRQIRLDRELPEAGPEDGAPVDGGAVPANLAYVIYTSGSTGRPKGVQVTHASVVGFFAAMDRTIGPRDGDTWLALTGLGFDISVLELLWPLTRGLKVVLRGENPIWSAAGGRTDATPARPLGFSLFYFASGGASGSDKYRLLLEGARLADRRGFEAVWTPERHFHDFGGLYPNPAVVGAAIAAVTERVGIRAGSVVLPLHDPIRVAEEWSVVDNLSNGRVGISFASGWQPDDFVLAPDDYRDRKEVMRRRIDTVRRLWRGESVRLRGGAGNQVEVATLPRPTQEELPIWVTAATSPETVRMAAELGAGLLTHLLAQSFEDLAATVALYRRTWAEHGHPGEGRVTLMIHTFVGDDLERVRATVYDPFCAYLKSSLGLIGNLMRSSGIEGRPDELEPEELDALLAHGFERYFPALSLMGTEETALGTVEEIAATGVDEIACLIDFGIGVEETLEGLEHLAAVRDAWSRRTAESEEPLAAQIARHGVTHLQTTPAMAEMLLSDPPVRDALGKLSALLVGGEALPPALAGKLTGRVGGPVLNMYGPTETTIWSSVWPVAGGGGVSIGRPIANTSLHLLDDHLRPVSTGAVGELAIGGAGLARGYGGRPGLTAERFVPDPFGGPDGESAGARLYRTGDLARRRHDGALEFHGRADHQVKIRGHRIEPGEVEAVLSGHPGVGQAAVAAREDGAGDTRLVAYYVPAGSAPLAPRTPDPRPPAGRRLYTLPNGMPVVSLDDYLTSGLYREIFEERLYERHGLVFDDGACIVDVGANVGFFTLFAHTVCRSPRVLAFEPIPPTFEVLRANVDLYGLDVELFSCGLGETSETSRFTYYPHMPGLSGRHADDDYDRAATRSIMGWWADDRLGDDGARVSEADLGELVEAQLESETFDCPVRTLSEIIAEHRLERIDLLKIDVERSEVEVLRGIRDEDWPKVRQLVLEVDTRRNLRLITELLEEKGFAWSVDDLLDLEGDADRAEVYVAMLYARRAEAGAAAETLGAAENGFGGGRHAPGPADLRAWLAERLPEPMIPSAFVRMSALPLNRNGKVDRAALPEPDGAETAVTADYVEPRDTVEKQIATIWSELLRVGRVGLRDNFFELGGSSLLVVRVRNRLREALGRNLSLVDLFRHPTVASLAAHLTSGEPSGGSAETVHERVEKRRSARRRRRRETVS